MKQLLENWRVYVGESVLYHASSPSNRRNIMSKGLEPGQEASYGPPAVYLFTEDFLAQNYVTNEPMDVWEVDVADYDLAEKDMRVYDESDEEAGEEYNRAALDFINKELVEK